MARKIDELKQLHHKVDQLANDAAINDKVIADLDEKVRAERAAKDIANAEAKEVRARFNDLKQRIYAAEMENQRLRGYVARVQEDDVVREELVTTGEPGGEQALVPKRKATQFTRPSDHTVLSGGDTMSAFSSYSDHEQDRERRKPKHWLSY